MSATILWIMCAAIVVALAVWLAMVGLAARRPGVRRPATERRRGRVQGGTHTGGGRSVAPSRDATAVPGENPEERSVSNRPGPARSEPGSPMDL
jgi:hypothetical protein